jgi:signal transduction histidine kinase
MNSLTSGVTFDAVGGLGARARAVLTARPLVTDFAAALVLAALTGLAVQTAIDIAPAGTYHAPTTAHWLTVVLALTVPLAGRRRFPLTALVVVTAATYFVTDIRDLGMSIIVYWVGLYSAGAYGDPRRRDLIRGLSVAASLAITTDRVDVTGLDTRAAVLSTAFLFVFQVFFDAAAWVAGNAMAARRALEQTLRSRADELQREREENARRAVFEERVRIARELHDVIAHHVSVMGVQAGAARRVMKRQPEKAEEMLSAIELASRQAVVELHRMLGFLRQDEDPDGLAPQPGIGQLDELIEHLRSARLSVDIHVDGEPRQLARSLDISAYRIVQEALTNTLKHASAHHATVHVHFGADLLEVDVVDDGRAVGTPAATNGGHGLIGMRERVSLHGGHLRVGPLPKGGYAVHAELPMSGQQ